MPTGLFDAPVMTATTAADLQTRIRAEFAEMPGLKLTLAQACRLFNAERADCEPLLMALVMGHELACFGELFMRADCGCRFAGEEAGRLAA
jgi:hypothetical protein